MTNNEYKYKIVVQDRLYLNQSILLNNLLLFHHLNQDEIYRVTKNKKRNFDFFLENFLFVTFLTVLSRSNAISGIFASSINENKFAKTFACLKIIITKELLKRKRNKLFLLSKNNKSRKTMS